MKLDFQSFLAIPLSNRFDIVDSLYEIRACSHLYYCEWSSISISEKLITRAIELVNLYESNQLQLRGLGCWFLNELLTTKSSLQVDITKLIDSRVVLNLMKIGLEYSVHHACFSILQTINNRQLPGFETIVNLGQDVIQILKVPIKSEQFFEFLLFLMKNLERRWDNYQAFSVIKILAALVLRVDPDRESQYFLQLYSTSILRYFHDDFLLSNAISYVAKFLCGLVALQKDTAADIMELGIADEVFQCIFLRKSAIITCIQKSSLLLLLAELCKKDMKMKCKIIQQLPLQKLFDDLEFDCENLLQSAVELYLVAYVPPRTPTSTVTSAFEVITLESSIKFLSTKIPNQVHLGCSSIRKLSRSVNILRNDLSDISLKGRKLLLDFIDNISNLELEDLVVVDALSALCGWKRIYWRSHKSKEFLDILNCLEDIRSNGVESNNNDFEPHSNNNTGSSSATDRISPKSPGSELRLNNGRRDTDSEECLTGQDLIYTTSRLLANIHYVDGFIKHWETLSYDSLIRKISYMTAISHCLGMDVLEASVNIHGVCDIIVDLLLYNRHSMIDYSHMQERCLQLINDITLWRPLILQSKVAVCEQVLEIVGNWENLTKSSLMLSCITALITLTYSDKIGTVGTLISGNLKKLHCIMVRLGETLVLGPLLVLCRELVPTLGDLDSEGLFIFLGWIVRGLQCEIGRTRARACQVISEIGSLHRVMFHEAVSRREVEESIMYSLTTITEPAHAIEAIKACTACIRHFNHRPPWIHEVWVYHWSIKRRSIIAHEMGVILSNVINQFKGASHILVLAFSFDFSAAVFSSSVLKDTELHRVLVDQIISLIPNTLDLLSQSSTSTTPEVDREDTTIHHVIISPELMGMAYELLGFHVLQLIQAFLCYDFKECVQRLHLYSDSPICFAVPKIMLKFPTNATIQRFGIDILRIFSVKKIDLARLGEYAPTALVIAVEACPHDADLLRSFCIVVSAVGASGSEIAKDNLIKSNVHKALCNILKTCSRDLSPVALQAVAHLADASPHRAKLLCECGIMLTVVRVSERHCDLVRVQIEGLRALLKLKAYPEGDQMIADAEGNKTIKRIRLLLSHRLKEGSLGADCNIDDVQMLINVSASEKDDYYGCKCLIS